MGVPYLFFLLILLLLILSIVLISFNARNYKKGGYAKNKRGGTKTKSEIINSISEMKAQLYNDYSVDSGNIDETIKTLGDIQIAINQREILEGQINSLLVNMSNSDNFNKTLLSSYIRSFNTKYPIDSSWNVNTIETELGSKQKQTGHSLAPIDSLIKQIKTKIIERNKIFDGILRYKSTLPIPIQNTDNYKETYNNLYRTKNILYSLNTELSSSEEAESAKGRRNTKKEESAAALEREQAAALEREQAAALEREQAAALEREQAAAQKIDQEFNITAHIQDMDSLSNSVTNNIIGDIESYRKELYELQQINTTQSEEIALMEEINSELESDNKSLSTRIEELHSKIGELMTKISNLEIELDKPKMENDADKLELIQIREENTELGNKYDLGAKRNAALDRQIFDQRTNILELQSSNEHLSKNKKFIDNNLIKKEIELAEYRKLLKEKEYNLFNLENKYRENMSKLRANIQKLAIENESLKGNLQNIEDDTYNNLKSEFTKTFEETLVPIRDDNYKLQKSNSRLGQNNSKLQKDNSTLQKDNSLLRQNNLELQQNNSKLDLLSNELFGQNSSLLEVRTELFDKNNSLETKLIKKTNYQKQAIGTIEKLTNQLQQLKKIDF